MRRKNAWTTYNKKQLDELEKLCKNYLKFLDKGKTERECVKQIVKQAEEKGYVNLADITKDKKALKAGDKVYSVCMDKTVALFQIGKKKLEKGMNILGAHIDSPRMDVKQNPLYESEEFAYLDTHYYGGIKKYQWVTLPLALHGVVVKKDGTVITVNVGEDKNDPVFCVTDLLIHLAGEQMEKKANKVIEGENLDVLVGSKPLEGKEKDAVKEGILEILKEKYDMTEEDFMSAEIEVVPAGHAREAGLDHSMVMSYGQDDRVCSYANLEAILQAKPGVKTQAALLTDKEEIGSYGNTGMESSYFVKFVMKLLALQGKDAILDFYETMENSEMLSADVNSCMDPMFAEVSEKDNASFLGYGINLTKYGGARGKSGSNDANAEFLQKIRTIFNEAGVCWQIGELGKVDQGGGGTIAFMMADWGAEVVDCGTAMLSMHAPYDLLSKADAYETYLAYKAFFESK